MNDRDTPQRWHRYLQGLVELVGKQPLVRGLLPDEPELGRVLTASFPDFPAPGALTGFTYGLSLADHPDWTAGRPEVCICVRTQDEEWVEAAATMVEILRGKFSFAPGKVLNRVEPVVEESAMRCFLMERLSVPGWDAGVQIEVGDQGQEPDVISLVQAYPIHSSEMAFIMDHGAVDFWSLTWDRFDPMRLPAV